MPQLLMEKKPLYTGGCAFDSGRNGASEDFCKVMSGSHRYRRDCERCLSPYRFCKRCRSENRFRLVAQPPTGSGLCEKCASNPIPDSEARSPIRRVSEAEMVSRMASTQLPEPCAPEDADGVQEQEIEEKTRSQPDSTVKRMTVNELARRGRRALEMSDHIARAARVLPYGGIKMIAKQLHITDGKATDLRRLQRLSTKVRTMLEEGRISVTAASVVAGYHYKLQRVLAEGLEESTIGFSDITYGGRINSGFNTLRHRVEAAGLKWPDGVSDDDAS